MAAKHSLAAAMALALGLVGSSARADIISDEEGACRGREEGAACTANGAEGTCAKTKCSRNRFDGENRTVEQVDCLVCSPGAQGKATPTKPDDPTPAKVDPPDPGKADPSPPTPAEPTPAKVDPPADAPAKAAPASAPGTDPPKTEPKKSGCMGTIGEPSTAVGSLVLGVVLFGLARRRRR